MADRQVVLKPGRDRSVRNRHPWVFSGAIERLEGDPSGGDLVTVCDHSGHALATGYYNPRSQIIVRVLTWEPNEAVDAAFWRRQLMAAIARREALALSADTDAYRLVNAESDGLPGLIVDRYGEWLVLQSLTLGIETRKAAILEALLGLLNPRGVYERSDVDVRKHEGLGAVTGVLSGEAPPVPLLIGEDGLRFSVDLQHGHKTGFYLDQRDNRRRVAAYCGGRDVLNVFSYTGGFGVYARRAGATSVVNLDSSHDALLGTEENLRLNDLARDDDEQLEGDAFQVLRSLRQERRTFDLVVLDPPKFAFTRSQLTQATRGYKDINMLGMQLLRPGGILCTFSCSGLVSEDLFQKVLFGASVDVGRDVRILERLGQAGDHPVLLSFPEGAYLKGFVCQVG